MARQVIAVNDIQSTVLDVQAESTKGGKVKFNVSFGDGNTYVTFHRPTAEAIAALKGQQAVLRIETVQNGQYTNYDIAELNPAPSIGGQVQQVGAPAASLIPPPATAAPVASGGITQAPGRDFEKETRGKVRHGAIIAGLAAAAATSRGETAQDLFGRAVQFAAWCEHYVYIEDELIAVEVPAEETPTIEGLVEEGVVTVGTAGLPWSK